MTHEKRIELRKKYKINKILAYTFLGLIFLLTIFIFLIPFSKLEIFLWVWVGIIFMATIFTLKIIDIGYKFDRERKHIDYLRHVFYRKKMFEAIKNRNYEKIKYFNDLMNQRNFRIEANGALLSYYLLNDDKEMNKAAEKYINNL